MCRTDQNKPLSFQFRLWDRPLKDKLKGKESVRTWNDVNFACLDREIPSSIALISAYSADSEGQNKVAVLLTELGLEKRTAVIPAESFTKVASTVTKWIFVANENSLLFDWRTLLAEPNLKDNSENATESYGIKRFKDGWRESNNFSFLICQTLSQRIALYRKILSSPKKRSHSIKSFPSSTARFSKRIPLGLWNHRSLAKSHLPNRWPTISVCCSHKTHFVEGSGNTLASLALTGIISESICHMKSLRRS